MTSRVPGLWQTIAASRPANAFKRLDLPAFGALNHGHLDAFANDLTPPAVGQNPIQVRHEASDLWDRLIEGVLGYVAFIGKIEACLYISHGPSSVPRQSS